MHFLDLALYLKDKKLKYLGFLISLFLVLLDLLDSYEKLSSAASHLAPAMIDLEVGHLRRFSFTWDILNKRIFKGRPMFTIIPLHSFAALFLDAVPSLLRVLSLPE